MAQEMAEFVLQVSDRRSVNYVITASIGQSRAWFWYSLNEISAALFTYDTLLTLSREVEHIWKPRPFFRLGTILYLLTRYPPLLVWTIMIYVNLGNPSITFNLQSVITPVQNLLSAIILCRFQLDLRERHIRRDDCTLDEVTLGTFKAATRRVHEAVIDEFGDTELIASLQEFVSRQSTPQYASDDDWASDTLAFHATLAASSLSSSHHALCEEKEEELEVIEAEEKRLAEVEAACKYWEAVLAKKKQWEADWVQGEEVKKKWEGKCKVATPLKSGDEEDEEDKEGGGAKAFKPQEAKTGPKGGAQK
ncbi:hypothetical protein BU17DRAFT_84772 [Hysterangium stoloniferum]|nr:hypothetical protein BU17DRAFT_84772 [Hysterangium stoloniferum]